MPTLPPHRHAFATPSLLSLSSHHPQLVESSPRNPFFPNLTFWGSIKCNASHNEGSQKYVPRSYRSISFMEEGESSEDDSSSYRLVTFEEAVKLFNEREYYACHDLLESLWIESNDPLRTLFHALLQCVVAFYHLFNQANLSIGREITYPTSYFLVAGDERVAAQGQVKSASISISGIDVKHPQNISSFSGDKNHKGAMMEMGEGLCKLRKLNLEEGPFYQFEQEISVVLNFIYQTQLEIAACNEDFCLTMEQTERSYQLLEGFGAGERLYFLENNIDSQKNDITYIVFDPQTSYGATNLPCTRVKLPTLEATRNHLIACENY